MLEPTLWHRRPMIDRLTPTIRSDQNRGQERAHNDIGHDEDDRLGVRMDGIRAVPEDEEDDVCTRVDGERL